LEERNSPLTQPAKSLLSLPFYYPLHVPFFIFPSLQQKTGRNHRSSILPLFFGRLPSPTKYREREKEKKQRETTEEKGAEGTAASTLTFPTCLLASLHELSTQLFSFFLFSYPS